MRISIEKFSVFVSEFRLAMAQRGTNANELAKVIGRDNTYIYQLLSGKKHSIAAGDMAKIEKFLGTDAKLARLLAAANQTKRTQRTETGAEIGSTVTRDIARSNFRSEGTKIFGGNELIALAVDEVRANSIVLLLQRAEAVADALRRSPA